MKPVSRFALIGLLVGAAGDATAAPAPAVIGQLRKNYDDCVYGSAAEQLKNPRIRDISWVAEQAFIACQTEEQAMAAALSLSALSAQQISAMMINIRLQLKNTLRDIAANPAKYSK